MPRFIPPMLARAGQAFDSPDHLFEPKWDGMRAALYVEGGSIRIVSRHGKDFTASFPDLAALHKLPAGTVLDGEIVVLDDQGKPDFDRLLHRIRGQGGLSTRWIANRHPAMFIAFDQIYRRHRSIMGMPLVKRREVLEETAERCTAPCVALSRGVVGAGVEYFRRTCEQRIEGMVAKRLDSTYRPSDRSGAWLKVKRYREVQCAVVGFVPRGKSDFETLLLASLVRGRLCYVGACDKGFGADSRMRINNFLWQNVRSIPLLAMKTRGAVWLEPGLFCIVRAMEMTPANKLRLPIFCGFCGDE